MVGGVRLRGTVGVHHVDVTDEIIILVAYECNPTVVIREGRLSEFRRYRRAEQAAREYEQGTTPRMRRSPACCTEPRPSDQRT